MKHLFLVSLLAEVTLAFPPGLTQKLQALAKIKAEEYNCSFSIAVRSWDDLIVAADGITDSTAQTKAQVTDKYAWGSGTKMFTAASIMHLVSKGVFSLNDTVSSLVDDILGKMQKIQPYQNFSKVVDLWGAQIQNITIRQLLSMQDSVPDFDTANPGAEGLPGVDHLRAVLYSTPDAEYSPPWLMSVPWVRKEFKKGFHYSSTNFLLLGLILAQHTNSSDWKNFDQAEFLPDHLKGAITFVNDGTPVSNGIVHGYDRTYYNMPIGQHNNQDVGTVKGVFAGWTASNLVGSAAAMANLTWELFAVHSIAPKQMIDQMIPTSFFYGLGTHNMGSLRTGQHGTYGWGYGHLGSTYGFQSGTAYYPAFNFTLAVATNTETEFQEQHYDTMCQAYNIVASALLNVNISCTIVGIGMSLQCDCTPQIEAFQTLKRQALSLVQWSRRGGSRKRPWQRFAK